MPGSDGHRIAGFKSPVLRDIMEKFIKYSQVVLLFLCTVSFRVNGQVKYEREYNLKKGEVPALALTFVDSCCRQARVKWYGEESLQGKSIEAKVRKKGSLLSIEFDTSGHVEDVEKKIRMDQIPLFVRPAIANNLDSLFQKYTVQKVQVQWVGSDRALHDLIQKENSTLSYTTRYEIVLKGRKQKEAKMYELLFDSDGRVLSVLEILQRNTDNLDY